MIYYGLFIVFCCFSSLHFQFPPTPIFLQTNSKDLGTTWSGIAQKLPCFSVQIFSIRYFSHPCGKTPHRRDGKEDRFTLNNGSIRGHSSWRRERCSMRPQHPSRLECEWSCRVSHLRIQGSRVSTRSNKGQYSAPVTSSFQLDATPKTVPPDGDQEFKDMRSVKTGSCGRAGFSHVGSLIVAS